ncbi:MAG: DUF3105 domain-containing protein [Candidatus Dormibacter sp.]
MSKTQRELKAMRQAQREEAAARQKARDRRNLLIIGGGVVGLALAIVVVALILNHQSQVAQASHLKFQAVTTPVGQAIADEGTATHVDPSTTPTYKFYPPTSGPHYNVQGFAPVAWQTIATLQDGQFVHNLEHGGIAILYNCPSGSDCTTLRNQLEHYVKDLAPLDPQFNEVKLVMTPYTQGMQKKVALVAWHYVDFLDSYDQNEITRFYESHVDRGPEQIP